MTAVALNDAGAPLASDARLAFSGAMEITLYLAFFAATTIMILLPGPSVLLTVAHAMAFGWRKALVTVVGATCGVAVQLAVTILGMASVMLLLAEWFEWLRWAGVAYLIYLGVRQWHSEPRLGGVEAAPASSRSLFLQGLVVTIPNPKSLLFMAAFLPQFIDPARSLATQFAIMVPTFLAITFVFTGLWALVADQSGHWFKTRRAIVVRNRISGSLMMGAGLGLALARRG